MDASVRIPLLFWFFVLSARSVNCQMNGFSICHDDYTLRPPDGVLKDHTFTWIGFTQYLHVTTGLLHHSKAPRVTLVHKQFVLGTAGDLYHLPKNYKLGLVIFGDYDRDEVECGMRRSQIKMGMKCPRAYIELPVADIIPHPEYSRKGLGHSYWLQLQRHATSVENKCSELFGVGNSLALVKLLRPLKSDYMIPVCLPTLAERERRKKMKSVFLVDYISIVPTDFDAEQMAKKTLRLYTHRECRRHRSRSKLGSEGVTHVLCTSGCGIRPGAPIATQTGEGVFELVGIAVGGAPCSHRSMRRRLNEEPPVYVDVYPYNNWIMNVVTASVMPRPYPHNFVLTDAGSSVGLKTNFLRTRKAQKMDWRARVYAAGTYCFLPLKRQKKGVVFYAERFEIRTDPKYPAKVHIFLKISAGIETTIVCARLAMPNRLTRPVIAGVGGYNISVRFSTDWFPSLYYFTLSLVGLNTTARDMQEWMPERSPGYW